ncbi:IclR family transcriptional regulator [Herbaspirillum lusitanum]|uniref:IclR family transcriptional regulator n=1 Tax=Herbaspirillum lusitanum TaxID=213312 RepID=UPI00031B7360|nr:helix-turn-helix domain-containing protein [Herbaspirillum lusitanum]
MGATDRSLSLLRLFTLEQPSWTAEQVSSKLQVSISTAYRYLLALEEIGLIAAVTTGRYVLGPAIIQLDRQIQLTDPLLTAARPIMNDLVAYAPKGSVVLLCRSFSDKVLCIHQVVGDSSPPEVSYDRGRPMPLFRGATSKVILAGLPARKLKSLYADNTPAISQAGLGESWDAFKSKMSSLRKMGHDVTHGELDAGRIGISVPVLNEERQATGSISYVVTDDIDARLIPRLISLLKTGSQEIELTLTKQKDE